MVARIASSNNMSAILNYNEKKVSRELPNRNTDDCPRYAAELIAASGFLKDTDRMNFYDKAERFTKLNSLNTRTGRNMLHISLNFDPSEKNLSKEQLTAITDRYMEAIGFKDQPYLVYQHNDAAHPHLHIVTNIIRNDGTRIDTYNIGKAKSEPARKLLEKEFNLVRAEESLAQKKQFQLQAIDAQTVIYGTTTETKAAMKQAVHEVFTKYKYASLPEYNAALRSYNIAADPGTEESRTRKHHGLVYRVLDEHGNKVGVPIKASAFYFKPTMKNLEENYKKNKEARKKHLPSIRNRIDQALLEHPKSLRDLLEELKTQKIDLVVRQNKTGIAYGLTYLDQETKTVINASDLGKNYTCAYILKQPGRAEIERRQQAIFNLLSNANNPARDLKPDETMLPLVQGFNLKVPNILSNLMRYDETFGRSPYELEEDRKIRQRRLR